MKKTGLTDQQLSRLCSSFGLLLQGGMTLADSAFLLSEEEDGALSLLLKELGRELDKGIAMSEAMNQQGLFPEALSGMVKIGERTGKMAEAFRCLAAFYEERHRAGRLLKNALAYPGLILLLMLGVVGVLLIQVLPVFDSVYASLGSNLTGIAAGLLGLGEALKRSLPVLFVLMGIGAAVGFLYGAVKPVRRKVDDFFKMRYGDRFVFRKFNNARFARALAMGLGSGLMLEEAMELSRQLLSDAPGAQGRCEQCSRMLSRGMPLSEAMENAGLLPPSAARMLGVGLRFGSGEKVMEEIADRLMEDAVQSLEDGISRVEPAMVLVSSLLVGVILLSVMLPLMNIMAAIG